jgi:hypothetical protein
MAKFWITPPELYKKWDKEFNFDFDPCPLNPQQNALQIAWGKSNYVNPPYMKKDTLFEKGKKGPTAFVRKAIEEQKKGNSSFLVLSTPSYVNLLLDANAQVRSLGKIRWIDANTNIQQRYASTSVTGFYLKSINKTLD